MEAVGLALLVSWFLSVSLSQRACLCTPYPTWKPRPACEEELHPGQVKGPLRAW